MEFPATLQTIAEVSIAFAGFTGLIVAFRKNKGPLTGVQKYRLQILLSLAFGALFLSLLPEILANFELATETVWLASALSLALYSAIFVSWWLVASQRIKRVTPELFNRAAYVRMALGHFIVLIAIVVLTLMRAESQIVGMYVAALVWYLVHAAQQFTRMLFIQPKNESPEEKP